MALVLERSRLTPQESLALVERIAQIADDKLARDIVILDMADVVGYTDYFLIATGNTGGRRRRSRRRSPSS